tara:strand:- start:11200 stop:12171 length:972 start_codon:yes stop_codon:yes gene_type:complete
MKNVLITGISGQDGIFLTQKIVSRPNNFCIYGVTRSPKNTFRKLKKFIPELTEDNLKLFPINLLNKPECRKLISSVEFDFVYNLSGPSNVYESLINPLETKNSITTIFDNLVTSLIEVESNCNFFQASSSEMYGNNGDLVFNEQSTYSPNSPYAEAKLINHLKIIQNNIDQGINFSSGIMFNHESEFRNSNFLFVKIIDKAIMIEKHKNSVLEVGSLSYKRDWSYAKDVVDAIFMINSNPKSNSYVIGSGNSYSIKRVVQIVFDELNLDYEKYVVENEKLLRPGDPVEIIADTAKIKQHYGWSASHSLKDILKIMIDHRLKNL